MSGRGESGSTYRIRRAESLDCDAIMALETSVFVSDAWSRDTMASELVSSTAYYLVAVDEAGTVIAYAGMLAPVGSPDSDVQTIAVSPEWRRRGIARDLMERLLAEAVDRGARESFLEVRVDNPAAQTMYESMGFEGIATRPRYYMPDGVDALVMRLRHPAPGSRATGADVASGDAPDPAPGGAPDASTATDSAPDAARQGDQR